MSMKTIKKGKTRKFKVRYIFIIALVAIIAGLAIAFLVRWAYKRSQNATSIPQDTSGDFTNVSWSQNSNSIPQDTNSNFTTVSWPGDSTPESTPSAGSEIVASIANSKASNSIKKEFFSLNVFESYDDAFDNAFVLSSGRYVSISLNANVEVENIKSTVSMFNPEADGFENFNGFSFKSSKNSNNEYRLTFKIPDNTHISNYDDGSINFVAVFEIVTNEGTSYVSCAY